MFKGQAGSQLG